VYQNEAYVEEAKEKHEMARRPRDGERGSQNKRSQTTVQKGQQGKRGSEGRCRKEGGSVREDGRKGLRAYECPPEHPGHIEEGRRGKAGGRVKNCKTPVQKGEELDHR